MATRKKIEVEIVADDQASDDISHVAAEAQALEGTNVEVELEADDKASGDLDRVAAEARALDGTKAEVEVTADTTKASASLAALRKQFGELGSGSKLGALASPAGAVALIAGGLLAAVNHAADAAIEAGNLANLTGDSVENASQLLAVWKSIGAEPADLQDVLLQMNGTLADNAELAAQIGVDLTDGATAGERFQQVVEILQGVADATERAQIGSKLFGEEGVRQVNALMTQYGDLGAAIESMPTLSPEDEEQARETKAELAELTREFEQFAVVLGQTVLPVLESVFGGLNDLFSGAEDFGRNVRRFFDEDFDREWAVSDAFDEAKKKAGEFDLSLLAGLATAQEVRDKIVEMTGSLDEANFVTLRWRDAQLPTPVAPGVTTTTAPTINNTIIYPPGTTPTATAASGNLYLSRNGVRTGP